MSGATVIHRFVTDLNPIQAEWIVVRAADCQSDPDSSLQSHLQNPLCGTAMPANGRLDEPTTLSLELKRGNREISVKYRPLDNTRKREGRDGHRPASKLLRADNVAKPSALKESA